MVQLLLVVSMAMRAAPGVPVWFSITVAIAAPLLLLLGALIGTWVARRGAWELDSRARREKGLRTVRWAAEMATREEGGSSAAIAMGVAALRVARKDSNLNEPTDKALIKAILDAINEAPTSQYHENQDAGRAPIVVLADQEGDDGVRVTP